MVFYKIFIGDILDRLFARYSARVLFLTLGIFFLLDFILTFIAELEDLSDFYTFNKILLFLLYTSIDSLIDIFPLSAIVSCIVCLGFVSDSGELIAARVSGKKLSVLIFAVLRPILFGLILVIFAWQFLIPSLQDKANKLKFPEAENSFDISENWLYKDNKFSRITSKGDETKKIQVYDLNDDGNLEKIVSSENLTIEPESWVLSDSVDDKTNEKTDNFIWENPPQINFSFSEQSLKHMSLTDNYRYWLSINSQSEKNRVGYEFWKKALEPISLICLIIFAMAISIKSIGRDKSIDRFVLGILIAFGFNLLIKIFGNLSLIFGFSAFWGILFSSLLLLLIGYRILRTV